MLAYRGAQTRDDPVGSLWLLSFYGSMPMVFRWFPAVRQRAGAPLLSASRSIRQLERSLDFAGAVLTHIYNEVRVLERTIPTMVFDQLAMQAKIVDSFTA